MAARATGFAGTAAVALVVSAVALVTVAHAAVVQLTGSTLFATRLTTGSAVPPPLVTEDFSVGGNLGGRTASNGNVWTALPSSNRWRVQNGVATSRGDANASAFVDVGRSQATVSVVLRPGSERNAGVVLNANTAGTVAVHVLYRAGGTIELRLRGLSGTTPQTIATVGVTPTGQPVTLEVTMGAGGVLTVRFAGSLVGTRTLAAADWALLSSNTRFGLAADADADTTFDDFAVRP